MPTTAEPHASSTPGEVRDPWTPLAELRRTVGVVKGGPADPAAVTGGPKPSYSVLRYDDCARVLRDGETFSSRIYERIMGPVMGRTILEMDDPEHRRSRAIAGHAFRQKTLQRWETELIEPLAKEMIDRFAGAGEVDLVDALTYPFPVQVIARILGLPHDDYPMFQQLAFKLTSVVAGFEASVRASQDLTAYLVPIVQQRRVDPADDLISELATAVIDGDALSDDEIVAYLRLLLPAGAETTYYSTGTLVFALLTHPDQLADVAADRALVAKAIEELLRWEPAIPFIPRLATKDVTIAGVDIPRGANVSVCLGSANRDETRFRDPERYDIHRPEQQHLAFAFGPHMCLGMHLARIEMRIVLNALLDRIPDMTLAPGPTGSATADPHIHGMGVRKPNCLPVRFTPR